MAEILTMHANNEISILGPADTASLGRGARKITAVVDFGATAGCSKSQRNDCELMRTPGGPPRWTASAL